MIFFSKVAAMNVRLTRQFERKEIRKTYVALCEGVVDAPRTIDAPIARIGAIKFGVRDEGKRAITDVTPIAAGRNATLVRLTLHTGRTHQIRVHLESIGHPLVGDWLYGERNATRPMLHALEVAMLHPATREAISVRAPLPSDFVEESVARGITDAVAVTKAAEPDGLEAVVNSGQNDIETGQNSKLSHKE
ncbi:MAG: RluA family pseudouridine synthase [Thermoanaerobaculia bacterium]